MPPALPLKLVTLSGLLDAAETVESIRSHGSVPPYGLALIPAAEVLETLRSLCRDGLIEARLTDGMLVEDPQYDEAVFRTYWFGLTHAGWGLLWRNHDAVMAYWATHGPA